MVLPALLKAFDNTAGQRTHLNAYSVSGKNTLRRTRTRRDALLAHHHFCMPALCIVYSSWMHASYRISHKRKHAKVVMDARCIYVQYIKCSANVNAVDNPDSEISVRTTLS